MSGFYVGQRVRLLKSQTGKVAVGSTGTVEAINVINESGLPCIGVSFDGYQPPPGAIGWGPTEDEIEPIRDDDTNTVVSWSQCVWKPNTVRT